MKFCTYYIACICVHEWTAGTSVSVRIMSQVAPYKRQDPNMAEINLSTEAVKDAMGQTFSLEEKKMAEKNVIRLQKNHSSLQASDELISLYCALRKLKGPGARISGNLLESWQSKAVQATMVKTSYWVVPVDQDRQKILDSKQVKPYILDPEVFDDLPPTVDVNKVRFVDQCVDRKLLGPGVSVIELSCGIRRDKQISRASNSSPHAPPSLTSPTAAALPALTEQPSAEALEYMWTKMHVISRSSCEGIAN